MYPDSLKQLIESFKYLPGIGEKSAERFAFSVLELDEEQVDMFSNSLKNVVNSIHKCPKCNTLTDLDVCNICSDTSRDHHSLCVFEDSKNVFLFEKLGKFNGKYHVLDGLISPLDGINPEDIGLGSLISRIHEEDIEEIILAFKSGIEGDTTALYIKRILGDLNIKITRLASGVPIGVDMEYVDSLTLERALLDRTEVG